MTYIPGHSVWVGYALESGSITESSDGAAPATISSAPTAVTYLGYMDVPEVTESYGNKLGYSVGSPYAMYSARGAIAPAITLQLRVGASGFLPYCLRGSGGSYNSYGMTPLVIYIGVAGQYTDVYRYCFVDTLDLRFQEGSAQEVTATVKLQAMLRQPALTGSYVKSPAIGDLSTPFSAPLLFHDVRQFLVETRAGSTLDYRQMLMGCHLSLSHGLERKGIRPNWGDDEPLSRTCYDIMPHLLRVSGEITLHDRLSENFFSGLVQSQNWGDIVIPVSDAPGGDSESANEFALTVVGPMPVSRTNRGTAAGSQISHSVAFAAQALTIT